MATPLIFLTNECRHTLPQPFRKSEVQRREKILQRTKIFDITVAISTLSLGILALFGVIPLPTVAYYTCLGVGSGVLILWMIHSIKQSLCPNKHLPCFIPKNSVRRKLSFSS